MHQTYSGEKIGVKPSSPLQNVTTPLVDLDSTFGQLTSGNTGKAEVLKGVDGPVPSEGLISFLRVDYYQGCCLWLNIQSAFISRTIFLTQYIPSSSPK